MKKVIGWIAQVLGIDQDLFETRWNVGVSLLTSGAFLVGSAFLAERTITISVQKKLVLCLVVSLIGILLSTKPKMTIVIGIAITAVRWLIAGILVGRLVMVFVALGLGLIAWILIRIDPTGTGFYVNRKH